MLTNAPHLYIQCDVPEDMTLVEWRRAHTAPRRPVLHRRVVSGLMRHRPSLRRGAPR
jgi:hypothetical protein